MKKKKNANELSNVFNELDKIDLTGSELDNQLIELGFDPSDLVKKVRERIGKINSVSNAAKENPTKVQMKFDPFLLAAGSKPKDKTTSKRKRKND
jgi:hypothetical protein